MKVRIKIPKKLLMKIDKNVVYRKVGDKLRNFGEYLITEIPNRTRMRIDTNLEEIAPLSESRIFQKGNDIPLFDTWRMMQEIGYKLSENNQKLDISNPNEYHKFHVLGTKNMPKRDYFGVSEIDIIKLEDLMYEGMMEIFGEWDRELQGTVRDEITYDSY